jgi:hypothetical protein
MSFGVRLGGSKSPQLIKDRRKEKRRKRKEKKS